MNNGETPKEASSRPQTVQVVVAVLGIVGVIGAALIGNWDKFSTKTSDRPSKTIPSAASIPIVPSVEQSTGGAQSPAISHVAGNVTVNIGTPESHPATNVRPYREEPLNLTGEWTANVMCCPDFTSESEHAFVFDLETDSDGEVHGTAVSWDRATEPILNGRVKGNRIYFETVWRNRPEWNGTVRTSSDDVTTFDGKVSGKNIDFKMIRTPGRAMSFRVTKQP